MNPCITTWPASVPTDDDDRPEASSAMPNDDVGVVPSSAEPDEDLSRSRAGQAARVEDRGGDHQHADVDDARDPIAMITSTRSKRKIRARSASFAPTMRCWVSAEWR